MLPIVVALAATVVLLVWMGFFMMGSLPLLVLKHDTPLDGRFIRGLFNVYYVAVILTASAAALSYVWSGKLVFAFGAATSASMRAITSSCERFGRGSSTASWISAASHSL